LLLWLLCGGCGCCVAAAAVAAAADGAGTHYGVPKGIVFGFPCTCRPDGKGWEIVDDMYIDQYSKIQLQKNVEELLTEAKAATEAKP
jgi:malate dehydrogenase